MASMQAPLQGVERIAVLRPNAVGDFVFALPALAALRAAWPQARITYLGRRWHREFLTGRPGPIDEVIELPPIPGVGAPADQAVDVGAVQAFEETLRARCFDIALQMYGGGGYSNPFVQRLGARLSAGLRADEAAPLDRWIAYRPWQNERLRLLEVAALAGARPVALNPALAVTDDDERALRLAAPGLPDGPLAVLQPGATDPRRRWPAERFAQVGDLLAAQGAAVVINGSADEQDLVRAVASAMRHPAHDLTGLPLGGLLALLRRAALLVSNDTGPLHLASAVGTPTVGIYWFMNLLVSAPLEAARHPYAVSTRLHCPVCGVENVRQRCPHDASFVADVPVDEVAGPALQHLQAASR